MNRRLCLLVLLYATTAAGAFAPSPASKGPPKEIANSLGMKLVLIPAGEFLLGSPEEERKKIVKALNLKTMPRTLRAEGPQMKMKIAKAFYMGVYEVTQGEYEKIMGKNPSHFAPKGAGKAKVEDQDTSRFPVDSVHHEEAVEFCKALSKQAAEKGRTYRLPTEAEWEYACRAGTKTATPFGDGLSSSQANFDGTTPLGGAKKGGYLGRTCKVGSYKPNAFGLYDTIGNVTEWCSDWREKEAAERNEPGYPEASNGGNDHAVRGGGWGSLGSNCRSSFRYKGWPVNGRSDHDSGFRVVCEVP